MLFTCDRAKAVWRAPGVGDDIAELLCIHRSGSVILEEVIRKGNKEFDHWMLGWLLILGIYDGSD
jgi:hypothetical protein